MQSDADLRRFVGRARELGAAAAKVIEPASIVTAPWVRLKCQYGCGGYNSSLCCPPHTPTPDQTRQAIDCYGRAILIHCKPGAPVKQIAVTIEREAFLQGFYKAFSMGSGPCRLCDECNLRSCVSPDEARPAMEACGVDVFATASANGFPIEVVRDRTCDQNYYAVVLID